MHTQDRFDLDSPRPEEKKNRKRRRKSGAAVVFGVLSLVFALAGGYFALSYFSAGERLAQQTAETARLREELRDYTPSISDDALIPFSTIQRYTDEAESLTDFISRFHPESLVYTDLSGEIIYRPIDTALKRHTYDWDFLTTDEKLGKALRGYSDESGVTALKVIDVSEFQGEIDWEKVKADGVAFAFLRAGLRGYESSTVFEDARLEDNLKGAAKAEMPIGIYFYSQAATTAEAVEEAQFVLEKIKGYKISCPIVIDMEEENSAASRTRALTAQQRTDIALAFMDTVRAAGYKPMIYANMRMFAENLELSRLEGYDKWFAQYFSRPYFPYEFGIWQYSYKGTVDGISGNVDMNLAFVDYSK